MSETERATAGERAQATAVAFLVFVAGAVLLGLEIAASRVLAPFFGNSLFVWGALIGVVLSGLAVGYWAGGALADRLPRPGLLVAVAGASALAVLAVPLADEHALELVVAWDPGPRLDPLLAAVLLFGPPSLLLAGVTPIAVRLSARSLARLGRTAGRLFSISTAGSILGTFATAFFLVPALGTDQLLGLAAAVLFLAVGVVAAVQRLVAGTALAVAAAAASVAAAVSLAPDTGATLSGASAQNWSPVYRLRGEEARGAENPGASEDLRVVFARDTRYHRLTVAEDETSRYLRFDNSFQSGMYVDDAFRTRFRYTDLFHLVLAYKPDARNVLFIGLGGGSSPKRMWRDFPRLELDVVELDPVVVDVARRYFAVPRDQRLRISVDDGRRYLAKAERRWDAIVIDAYFADSIPFHLTTYEFLDLARSRLAPGGILAANVIGAIEGPRSKLFRSMYRTYRAAFPTVLVHPTIVPGDEGDESYRNLIVLATEGAAPSPEALVDRWARIRDRAPSAPDLGGAIRDRYDAAIPVDDVPTLTDGYAPTDALLLLYS